MTLNYGSRKPIQRGHVRCHLFTKLSTRLRRILSPSNDTIDRLMADWLAGHPADASGCAGVASPEPLC